MLAVAREILRHHYRATPSSCWLESGRRCRNSAIICLLVKARPSGEVLSGREIEACEPRPGSRYMLLTDVIRPARRPDDRIRKRLLEDFPEIIMIDRDGSVANDENENWTRFAFTGSERRKPACFCDRAVSARRFPASARALALAPPGSPVRRFCGPAMRTRRSHCDHRQDHLLPPLTSRGSCAVTHLSALAMRSSWRRAGEVLQPGRRADFVVPSHKLTVWERRKSRITPQE